jgi:polyphosphate kinase
LDIRMATTSARSEQNPDVHEDPADAEARAAREAAGAASGSDAGAGSDAGPRVFHITSDEAVSEDELEDGLPADRFADRELSWLAFNKRVLEQAEDTSVPIL